MQDVVLFKKPEKWFVMYAHDLYHPYFSTCRKGYVRGSTKFQGLVCTPLGKDAALAVKGGTRLAYLANMDLGGVSLIWARSFKGGREGGGDESDWNLCKVPHSSAYR